MHRRDFIKTSGAALAGTTLNLPATSNEPALPGRTILPINRGWRFHPSSIAGAEEPTFEDSSFESVVLPHSNRMLPWHNFDDKEYEFLSTYRRRFKTPPNLAARRVFVDFEGSMTASTVWINGTRLGEYRGGFTPFSFDLTDHLKHSADNTLVVQVDSTERADIPPFGYEIDYLTFGGLYREVSLRLVPNVYLDNLFIHAENVLDAGRILHVDTFIAGHSDQPLAIEVLLHDGETLIASGRSAVTLPHEPQPVSAGPSTTAPVHATTGTQTDPAKTTVALTGLDAIKLWQLDAPHLYTVRVRLLRAGRVIDEDTRRFGFREAVFTDHGFSLNGNILKLRGLDRHQTFPFAGQAMPARVQRRDAHILRHKLHCNIVRTSHYPQSRHFLDCCDEIGLLVLEEFPGWQHIGDQEWQNLAIDNVDRMIRRDWNHPSIILWGVRINESKDNHDFYVKTNALAHALDSTRPTGGIRNFQASEFLEDVFTINDFGFPLKKPNHSRYLNTEFVGHTFSTKTTDDNERQREHTLRHARVHNQLASDPQYAGGIGWCAFDYNTHANFGSGDRICYHGVTDIFREPKAAAGFYKSQCEPSEEIVLEPAFHWARGDESLLFTRAVVCSNCNHLKFYMQVNNKPGNPWELIGDIDADHAEFEHLKYPPFVLDVSKIRAGWGDLRIDGYIAGQQVISKKYSGRGVVQQFVLRPDDTTLAADGADATRIVLRSEDQYGNICPYGDDAVVFTLEGPATLIGNNPFSMIGGTGAVWIRAGQQPGTVTLTATSVRFPPQSVTLQLTPAAREAV